MYKRVRKHFKPIIPAYAILPLLFCVLFNCMVYFGAGVLTDSWKHYDFTTSFDRAVPLIPEFVLIYLGCYIFWIANYILIARQGKEYCMRFALADVMSRVVCGIFFLLLPTTNIRPELTGNGIWVELLKKVYLIDSPTKLFPSIHCLVSWFCFIGIRGQEKVPKAYRIFSCIFALLVCLSTQVTKQHYIIDVFGAILIAEFTYYVSFHVNWYQTYERIFDRMTNSLFRRQPLYKKSEKSVECDE